MDRQWDLIKPALHNRFKMPEHLCYSGSHPYYESNTKPLNLNQALQRDHIPMAQFDILSSEMANRERGRERAYVSKTKLIQKYIHLGKNRLQNIISGYVKPIL